MLLTDKINYLANAMNGFAKKSAVEIWTTLLILQSVGRSIQEILHDQSSQVKLTLEAIQGFQASNVHNAVERDAFDFIIKDERDKLAG